MSDVMLLIKYYDGNIRKCGVLVHLKNSLLAVEIIYVVFC